jgi:hypothetical protein
MATTQIPPRDRRSIGYEMLPAEDALAGQLSIATRDWPDETRRTFIECIIAALDEARADGVAAALNAANADDAA